jgi:hypothetical protein
MPTFPLLDPDKTGRQAENLESSLRQFIVGQEEAIHQIVRAYKWRVNLRGISVNRNGRLCRLADHKMRWSAPREMGSFAAKRADRLLLLQQRRPVHNHGKAVVGFLFGGRNSQELLAVAGYHEPVSQGSDRQPDIE